MEGVGFCERRPGGSGGVKAALDICCTSSCFRNALINLTFTSLNTFQASIAMVEILKYVLFPLKFMKGPLEPFNHCGHSRRITTKAP